MVRTLDFHSNNVGSIPAGLKKIANLLTLKLTPQTQLFINETRPVTQPPHLIQYKLYFTSLVPPLFLPETRLSQLQEGFSLPKKVKLKQSYLQLSWFFYLSHAKKRSSKRVTLLILPCKRKLYTLTKAPMAHKTNSKEQFNFKFYYFRAAFTGTLVSSNRVGSVNQALFLLLLYKQTFPVFDTNLLYLRGCSIKAPGWDTTFYSYFCFQQLNNR